MLLGTSIQAALESIGVTEDRVTSWLGAPCHCQERVDKLNQLDLWARKTVSGKFLEAKKYFEEMVQP